MRHDTAYRQLQGNVCDVGLLCDGDATAIAPPLLCASACASLGPDRGIVAARILWDRIGSLPLKKNGLDLRRTRKRKA